MTRLWPAYPSKHHTSSNLTLWSSPGRTWPSLRSPTVKSIRNSSKQGTTTSRRWCSFTNRSCHFKCSWILGRSVWIPLHWPTRSCRLLTVDKLRFKSAQLERCIDLLPVPFSTSSDVPTKNFSWLWSDVPYRLQHHSTTLYSLTNTLSRVSTHYWAQSARRWASSTSPQICTS